ncbi:MAG: methyltransferase domain-containing protein [Acidobacteria bacterium]|nr:methyltransferase domain-containing protein [Acidobacteriota bacterium]
MLEFTGERVVPGQVEQDLWNEHVSRYAFAARFAMGKRALDLGCGAGYGAAELSRTARQVVGVDLDPAAALYAARTFPVERLRFVAASASAVPFARATFELVTAFEVIEHLTDWAELIAEARRVLTPDGVFIVSTPNKAYYTASRGAEGSNPYHVHEFEFAEFRDALLRVFPNVGMLLQNRSEAFVFHPPKTYADVTARIDSSGGLATEAHFFVAVCSADPPPTQSFVYVPRAANVLAERERHIAMLESDLGETKEALAGLHAAHQKQTGHLEDQNRWAMELEAALQNSQKRVVELQDAYADEQRRAMEAVNAYEKQVRGLQDEGEAKTRWALETERRLTAEIERLKAQLGEVIALKESVEAAFEERTRWALQLKAQLEAAEGKLAGAQASRWVKTGRLFGIGPEL